MEKLYYIEWHDSKSRQGWASPEEINHKPLVCVTVGFMLHKDDVSITVAASFCEKNNTFAEIVTIPTENIIKKKLIKL